MNVKVDVLAVLDRLWNRIALHNADQVVLANDVAAARAAVAELIEAAQRAEVSFNTVRGCYERNPGNFMAAMRELEQDILPLRAALTNIGSAR